MDNRVCRADNLFAMTGFTQTSDLSLWPSFAEQIIPRLNQDDDPALWQAVIETVIGDAESACQFKRSKTSIIAEIGCCSHWLAPHKLRWMTPNGVFVGPSGYQVKRGFLGGLPEFDWHSTWQYDLTQRIWRHAPQIRPKRPLLLRIAVPARSACHLRATVHAMWCPGPRPVWNCFRMYYGFRKRDDVWKCKAYLGL